MHRQLIVRALVAVFVCCAQLVGAQEVLVNLTPDAIQEAIRIGSDERASAKFLQPYVIQTRTGMGTGPLLGYYSTPFARVVLASAAARRQGKVLTPSDIGPELLTAELQLMILAPQAAYADTAAGMQGVIISRRGGNDGAIEPVSVRPASQQDATLYGLDPMGATIASFPLSAVASGNVIRVSFGQIVRGSSAMTHCKDCIVPLATNAIR